MGYLTTITIYNDGCDLLKENAKEFAEKTHLACLGRVSGLSTDSFGVGNHGNLVTVQKPRHADDKTVYVHAGNTVVEMSPYSDRTKDILESSYIIWQHCQSRTSYI